MALKHAPPQSLLASRSHQDRLEPSQPQRQLCQTSPCLRKLQGISTQHTEKQRGSGRFTEGEFFQRSAKRFGEKEVDKDTLETKPAAVEDQPSPLDVLQSNRIDESCEETGQSAPQLEVGNTTGAFRKRPQFDQVGISESIVSGSRQSNSNLCPGFNPLTRYCTQACRRI